MNARQEHEPLGRAVLSLIACLGAGCAGAGAAEDAGWDAGRPPPAPTITSDLPFMYGDAGVPRQHASATSARFTFTSPGATGYLCQLDGAEALSCASGAEVSVGGSGDHSLSVRAVASGGTSPASTVFFRTSFDCTGGAACPEVDLQSIDPRANPASVIIGYADPSLKTFQGTSWLAYSWTSSHWPAGVGTPPEVINIQTHLARSSNGGDTWTAVGPQFGQSLVAEPVNRGAGAELGYPSSEEIDLEAAMLGTPPRPYWFWIRQKYFNPAVGSPAEELPPVGSMKEQTQHLRLGMLQAEEPIGMSAEESRELVFFTPSTPPAFRAQLEGESRGHVDLVADLLGAHGIRCDIQWSSSVLYRPEDGFLYLLIECNLVGSRPLFGSTFPVLRARPTDGSGAVLTPDRWTWELVGTIGTTTEGMTELAPRFRVDPSGTPTNLLIQPSFARGADGGVLLVTTPNLVDASGGHRLGCTVTELTLSPLALVMDAFGNPRHRAHTATPDLARGEYFNQQAGSCDYDAVTGLYQARKVPRSVSQTLTSIHRTGIRGL